MGKALRGAAAHHGDGSAPWVERVEGRKPLWALTRLNKTGLKALPPFAREIGSGQPCEKGVKCAPSIREM
jgi:hypothetical protein